MALAELKNIAKQANVGDAFIADDTLYIWIADDPDTDYLQVVMNLKTTECMHFSNLVCVHYQPVTLTYK